MTLDVKRSIILAVWIRVFFGSLLFFFPSPPRPRLARPCTIARFTRRRRRQRQNQTNEEQKKKNIDAVKIVERSRAPKMQFKSRLTHLMPSFKSFMIGDWNRSEAMSARVAPYSRAVQRRRKRKKYEMEKEKKEATSSTDVGPARVFFNSSRRRMHI